MSYAKWTGQSGQQYSFQIYPVGTYFNSLPGVYVFCSVDSFGTWSAKYVGETGDFSERLDHAPRTHHAWPLARAHGATHIGALVLNGLGGRQLRLDVETDLRHRLRPPANKQSA